MNGSDRLHIKGKSNKEAIKLRPLPPSRSLGGFARGSRCPAPLRPKTVYEWYYRGHSKQIVVLPGEGRHGVGEQQVKTSRGSIYLDGHI